MLLDEYLSTLFSVSEVEIVSLSDLNRNDEKWNYAMNRKGDDTIDDNGLNLVIFPARLSRCPRCRLHAVNPLESTDDAALCTRCTKVVTPANI